METTKKRTTKKVAETILTDEKLDTAGETTPEEKPKASLAYLLLVALGYDGSKADDKAMARDALAEIKALKDNRKIEYHITKCCGTASPAWKATAQLNAEEQGKKWALEMEDGTFIVGGL
jgi:hypothetical protein